MLIVLWKLLELVLVMGGEAGIYAQIPATTNQCSMNISHLKPISPQYTICSVLDCLTEDKQMSLITKIISLFLLCTRTWVVDKTCEDKCLSEKGFIHLSTTINLSHQSTLSQFEISFQSTSQPQSTSKSLKRPKR